ncbi:hypothetical protein [Sandaracinus amylolyticus]|uniref:Uncharacterized protein n=1 Tax=Sandaracinus amylolyticus TaxID=927083 RepID=A0A0F6SDM9_9BACT|nr:hypothetical protein [Sandaracinus amylolyticus]AKF03724.1 hypothetical protein DB32_000873 [Sandaracinus amylolyticus]
MKSCFSDTRGAITVLGLFAALVATGLVFYVVGVGEAIRHRETMQDAADASAFAAAVLHARGMNLLVLVNLVMAGALAVLVMLKVLITVVAVAIAIVLALAIPTFGASLVALAPLTTVQTALFQAEAALRGPVFAVLRIGNRTAAAIRRAVPAAAWARANAVVQDDAFDDIPETGVPLPPRIELPTEDDDFERLCGRAGRVVGEIVMLPFDKIGVLPDAVQDAIGDAIEALVAAFSPWFCGAGEGGVPPKLTYSVERWIPSIESTSECLGSQLTSGCLDAGDAELNALFDQTTGACPAEGAAGHDDCLTRAEDARHECRTTPGIQSYVYQIERRRRAYWAEDGRVRHTDDDLALDSDDPSDHDEVLSSERSERDERLCDGRWSEDPRGPACVITEVPRFTASMLPELRDAARVIEIEVVRHVHACLVEEEQTLIEQDPGMLEDRTGMASQRVAFESGGFDVELGGEPFQMRILVMGETPSDRAARGVAVAGGGSLEAGGDLPLADLGRMSIAQAEMYYPSTDLADRPDWMWNMRWRARMRRVHVPAIGMLDSACSAVPGLDCTAVLGPLQAWGTIIAH